MGEPPPAPASAIARGARRPTCEVGLESIEVALIVAAVVLMALGGVPILHGGIQNALTAVATTLSTTGGIN